MSNSVHFGFYMCVYIYLILYVYEYRSKWMLDPTLLGLLWLYDNVWVILNSSLLEGHQCA